MNQKKKQDRRDKNQFARQRDADKSAAVDEKLQVAEHLAQKSHDAISNATRIANEDAQQNINRAYQASFFISRSNIVVLIVHVIWSIKE